MVICCLLYTAFEFAYVLHAVRADLPDTLCKNYSYFHRCVKTPLTGRLREKPGNPVRCHRPAAVCQPVQRTNGFRPCVRNYPRQRTAEQMCIRDSLDNLTHGISVRHQVIWQPSGLRTKAAGIFSMTTVRWHMIPGLTIIT